MQVVGCIGITYFKFGVFNFLPGSYRAGIGVFTEIVKSKLYLIVDLRQYLSFKSESCTSYIGVEPGVRFIGVIGIDKPELIGLRQFEGTLSS